MVFELGPRRLWWSRLVLSPTLARESGSGPGAAYNRPDRGGSNPRRMAGPARRPLKLSKKVHDDAMAALVHRRSNRGL
jgi:hypothetical protein